jgi:hypothetical protein
VAEEKLTRMVSQLAADLRVEAERKQMATTAIEGKPVSKEEARRQQLMQVLDALGSESIGDDSVAFEGTKIVLPADLQGPGAYRKARDILLEMEKAEDQEFEFSRTFPYRPYDGAAAFARAMKRVFGTAGIGNTWRDMFGGKHLPQLLSVDIGVNKRLQVPWDEVRFTELDATFEVGGMVDPERGVLSHISVEAPRKHRARIEGFFTVIEEELKERSIYRGKAINGSGNPGFFDTTKVNSRHVIYTGEVMTQLNANVWAVIDHSKIMQQAGIPLKRAVLLEGPWGTGKTLAGALTAQHAVDNGWTFILVRPEDSPLDALRTAQLYAPAVVWVEDVDNVASKNKSRAQISQVLDAMDNIAGKNQSVMCGFTTNYPELIERGMLRPGRIDAVIHLDALDRDGIEQLVKVTVPSTLLKDIDYDEVAKAYEGYVPAYAVEAAQRAVRYSIARNQGPASAIATSDLVAAADGLRRQLDMMNGAAESDDQFTVESALKQVIVSAAEDTLKRTQIDNVGRPFSVLDNGSVSR